MKVGEPSSLGLTKYSISVPLSSPLITYPASSAPLMITKEPSPFHILVVSYLLGVESKKVSPPNKSSALALSIISQQNTNSITTIVNACIGVFICRLLHLRYN